MDLKKKWLSRVMEELKDSPLATTLCFGLIQMLFEKLMEVEFACPCDARYNHLYTSVFFFVPPIIVFLLMCVIKCPSSKSPWKTLSSTIIPALTWLIIVFLDGRYYACSLTDWSGKYELIENAEPQKWCNPVNSSEELLAKTQLWYSKSEYIAFWTAFLLALFGLICLAGSRWLSCCMKNEHNLESPRDGGSEQL